MLPFQGDRARPALVLEPAAHTGGVRCVTLLYSFLYICMYVLFEFQDHGSPKNGRMQALNIYIDLHHKRVRLLPAVTFSEGGPTSAELKRRKKEKREQVIKFS